MAVLLTTYVFFATFAIFLALFFADKKSRKQKGKQFTPSRGTHRDTQFGPLEKLFSAYNT